MSENLTSQLAFLGLGWLLGLLTPLITEATKRRRETRLAHIAIRAELQEVSLKLVLAVCYCRKYLGEIDRDTLIWLKSKLQIYEGIHRIEPTLEWV